MKILLTGAFGNVGISTLNELLKRNYNVRIFELKTPRNKKLYRQFAKKAEIAWGDLRDYKDVLKAMEGIDAVIHLGAIIPPLADKNPRLAEAVNVGGTQNIINAIKMQKIEPKLIFSSSIATYGDRRKNPLIKVDDPLTPSSHDEYAKQKVRCETMIRNADIDWTIFRLTYIVSLDKLQMDPLMFEMPLETSIEICDTSDVGYALVNAIENPAVIGHIMNLAGGEKCRTTYKAYLEKMFELFGMGRPFPESAFSTSDFHCGYMDTHQSQDLLNYQRKTLDDYYHAVQKKVALSRFFTTLFRPVIRQIILAKSRYYTMKSV